MAAKAKPTARAMTPAAEEAEILPTRQVAAEPAATWRAGSEPALVRRRFGPASVEAVGTTPAMPAGELEAGWRRGQDRLAPGGEA